MQMFMTRVQTATCQLVRQVFLTPAAATSPLPRTYGRPFSTDFIFDEDNFRAPDLQHGLEVPTVAHVIFAHDVVCAMLGRDSRFIRPLP